MLHVKYETYKMTIRGAIFMIINFKYIIFIVLLISFITIRLNINQNLI